MYNLDRQVHSKKYRIQWFKGSAILSLGFFSLNEAVFKYFESQNIYHNFWTDYTLSGYLPYQVLHRYLRRQLIQESNTQIKLKCQKYCMFLTIFGMFFERYLEYKRQQLILTQIKGDECPYILSDQEYLLMKRLAKNKQFAIINLLPKGVSEGNDIGGFLPLIAVHDDRKDEIEVMNSEVNRKLGQALKRLILKNELSHNQKNEIIETSNKKLDR